MKRDEVITFQEETTTYDEYNQPIKAWADIATTPKMWAKATPLTGSEDFRNVQEQGFQRYQFKVLHRDDLDIQMRISWDGKFWNIRSITRVQNMQRNKMLEIIAEWEQGNYEN